MKTILNITTMLSFLFIISAFYACEKQDVLESTVVLNRSSDSCNTQSLAGTLHNEGVAYVLSFQSELEAASEDDYLFMEFVVSKTEEYLSSTGLEGVEDLEPANIEQLVSVDWSNLESQLDDVALTTYEKELLLGFDAGIVDYDFVGGDGLNAFSEITESTACVWSEDAQIENIEPMLGYLSVAQNSAIYWTNNEPFSDSDGDGISDTNGPIWDTIKADANGFVDAFTSTFGFLHSVRTAVVYSVTEWHTQTN